MRVPIILLAGAACLGIACGQQAGISGPVEGYTFDPPTASLRAVFGFPGAASFGPAILTGLELGSVAPQHNYGLALQSGNFMVVNGLDSGAASSVALNGVAQLPDGVIWSGDGSVAVLYSRGSDWLQIISGLPSNPVAGGHINLSVLGSLTAVALDQAGQQIAVAMSGPQSGLYLMSSGQAFARVIELANPVAVAFSTDGTTLLAIDAATRQLASVSLSSLAFQMTGLDGLADPFAVQESAGQKIYIASRSDRLLRELDSASGQTTDLPLTFSPTGIEPFGANSLVVGSRVQPTDPLWLVTNGTQPATYFVPAIPQTIGRPRASSPGPVVPNSPREDHR